MKKKATALTALLLLLPYWYCAAAQNTTGKIVVINNQHISVSFIYEDVARVQKWITKQPPKKESLVVVGIPNQKLSVQSYETDNAYILQTAKLQVSISKFDGCISFYQPNSKLLLKEQAPATFELYTKHGEVAYSVGQPFILAKNEAIYGLGQHQYGYLNYRGKEVKLVQTNTDAVTPFFISTNGYGLLWDCYSKTIFDDTKKQTTMWSEVADEVDYYLAAGNTMDDAIKGYRKLTGSAPMYGRWAYGYWQSKEHYENRDELLSVANEYRKRKIPIDNIIQDWDYWDGNTNWGQLYFDEKKYPNPKEMVDMLHAQNFHLMISIWCSFGQNTPVYKAMDRMGLLYPTVGWAGFKYFDAYNPKATDLFWDFTNRGLYSKGIDGWWMDSTEPDVINANTKESTEYELKRMPNNHLGSFARYLNPYSLLATEAVYKNQRKVSEKQRAYILTRSTFAGQQRAAATTWSGDIGASWSIYKKQIAAGLNHSMSGIPYWTFDIGAFVLGSYGGVFTNGGKDPAYQELYTRMFQFGAFCPIFRSHGSETPREIWEFGEFSDALIKFDNLRYRLMPYIYSLAGDVYHNHYTLMRALSMDFSADTSTYNVDDQLIFGPSIMVCPVTEYMLHRPPSSSIPVPSKVFSTDGKQGLKAKYYKDATFKQLSREQIDSSICINWYATGRPDYVTDSTLSIKWDGELTPTETGKYQLHVKCYGPKRIKIDGKELAYSYKSVESVTEPIMLEASKKYHFEVETENGSAGAFRVELYWKTPSIFAQEQEKERKDQTRKVYLPIGSRWFDFWNGTSYQGGQSIISEAPIDRIPIFIRAGSIIPMGPFVQYANEKLNEPIELRVYPGADGKFVLYEDENDGYGYEKGAFSTIELSWNDAKQQLTIGERKGSFPGMQLQRKFNVTLCTKENGTGIPISIPNKKVSYNGKKQAVQL